jgi:hypothetical protein
VLKKNENYFLNVWPKEVELGVLLESRILLELNICFNWLEIVDFLSVFNETDGENDAPDMELSESNEENDIPIVLLVERCAKI